MSSKPITNITIAFVPNDKAVIALILEYLQICRVKKMCVFPDFKRNQMCFTAFIEVAEWCDREVAYNLIRKIQDPRKEARIVYADDNWWVVEETKEEDLKFTQNAEFAKWTTEFQQPLVSFKDEDDNEDKSKPKKQVKFKRGVQIEEVMMIEDLDLRCAQTSDFDDFCKSFGREHGFDFEAEYKEWSDKQNFPEISAEQEERHDQILKEEFESAKAVAAEF
jgi:hypothetical protein